MSIKYVVDFSSPQDSVLGKCILSMLFDGVVSLWDHGKRVSVYDGGSHRLTISIEDTLDGYSTLLSFLRIISEEYPQISGLIEDVITQINGGKRMVIVRNFKNCEEIQVG